ncbi:hypothetical protein J3F84DRAFT_355602 [Trichoderma pleuroticola]
MRWIYRILTAGCFLCSSTSTFVSVASNRRKAKKREETRKKKCVCACFMRIITTKHCFTRECGNWACGTRFHDG